MKKFLILTFIFLVSGCVNAEYLNVLPQRNAMFKVLNGYRISFYDNKPHLLKSEKKKDYNYRKNIAQTVNKGDAVLESKEYQKDFYVQTFFKSNKNGVLNSSSLPVGIKADKQYEILGEIHKDGQRYRLFSSELEEYAVLVNDKGEMQRNIGQIDGKYLIVLESEFFPYPADLKMYEVNKNSSEQSSVVNGFEVKYDGVKLDRIWFTYLDYASGNQGMFKTISFPNKPGLITIAGIGFRVLNADKDKITYVVLSDN